MARSYGAQPLVRAPKAQSYETHPSLHDRAGTFASNAIIYTEACAYYAHNFTYYSFQDFPKILPIILLIITYVLFS